MRAGDEDRRERITVFMVADRQKVQRKFHCISCQSLVAEIIDKVVYLSDSADDRGIQPDETGALRVPCKNKWCTIWYEFIMRPTPKYVPKVSIRITS